MRVLWLPDVLRAAGLTVHEVPGWRTRGNDSFGPVRGITCHHTAGSRNSTVEGEIRVLLNGSESAPPPIAQLFLARNGDWHVIASGLCYHNKVGWDGPNEGYGNDALLGIEAQHSGGDEPWTPVQYDSYVRGVAALVRHKASGWDVSVSRVAGHKEHQPGSKSDPTFNMTAFRTAVAREISDWEDDMSAADVAAINKHTDEKIAALKTELFAQFDQLPREQIWRAFEWPSGSMSWNNLAWLLQLRTDHIGNVQMPAVLAALQVVTEAITALRADVAADEATDATDRDAILARVAEAEANLRAAIEAQPDESETPQEPAKPPAGA